MREQNHRAAAGGGISLGLRNNWGQFWLLVLVNAFVGGMVGLERTVVPLVGTEEFKIGSALVVFTFIIAFGVVKAFSNFASGLLADRFTRKSVLLAGWAVGLPVPFLLAWGPTWESIVFANVLLGLSQGLAWSMTINMKIDLAGPKNRGLAMGLNEFAGYVAVGLTALATGYIAARHGLRPEPFYLGIAYTTIGFALSLWAVRDTRAHARLEEASHREPGSPILTRRMSWVVAETSWRNRTLFGASQAGLINNLNDGMSWGVFPILFAAHRVSLEGIGLIKAVYPLTWGLGQLATGALSDKIGRKPLIVAGMLVQAFAHAIIGFGLDRAFLAGMLGSILLGLGTAMVYPALLAAVGDAAQPSWRASAVGVYRFWRDMGYAVGALMAGLVAGAFGLVWAVHVAGALTLASGLTAWIAMRETVRLEKLREQKH